MTKTERTVVAVLVLALGVLLITLKVAFLEMLLIVGGICLIGFGVVDVFRGFVPPAVVKIAAGGLLILCCVFVVKAILFIISAVLLVIGVLLLYDKLKSRKCFRSLVSLVCEYAIPALFLVMGALLLCAQGEGADWLFILCGIFTILIGVALFVKMFTDD